MVPLTFSQIRAVHKNIYINGVRSVEEFPQLTVYDLLRNLPNSVWYIEPHLHIRVRSTTIFSQKTCLQCRAVFQEIYTIAFGLLQHVHNRAQELNKYHAVEREIYSWFALKLTAQREIFIYTGRQVSIYISSYLTTCP